MRTATGHRGSRLHWRRGIALDLIFMRHVSHNTDAFPDDDAPVVKASPGPTNLAPIPAVSRGAVVGPARKALRIKTAYDIKTAKQTVEGII